MKLLAFITVLFTTAAFSQRTVIEGHATDSSNGIHAIEIVINDTLSKIMKNPKTGRQKYLKIYQDPRYVVRTDSTGIFKITADEKDSLYFKSYQHKTQAHAVKDLLKARKIKVLLKKDECVPTE